MSNQNGTKKLPTIEEEEIKEEYIDFKLDDLVITDKIGQGGFGVVNLCKLKMNQTQLFALKVIEIHNEEIQLLVENEIKILKKLKDDKFCNDFLLCYRGSSIIGNNYYILTDYVQDSIPLSKMDPLYIDFENINKINKDNEDVKTLIEVFSNVYSAILEIHRLKIIHSDIKPDNILYNSKNKTLKIIDFGGSFDNASLQFLVDNYTFTPQYVDFRAEQYYETHLQNDLKNEVSIEYIFNIFQKSDIWSLCISIFEKLLGDQAFYSQAIHRVASKKTSNYDVCKFVYFSIYTKGLNNTIHPNFKKIYKYIDEDLQVCDALNKLAVEMNKELPNIREQFAPYDFEKASIPIEGGTRNKMFLQKKKKKKKSSNLKNSSKYKKTKRNQKHQHKTRKNKLSTK